MSVKTTIWIDGKPFEVSGLEFRIQETREEMRERAIAFCVERGWITTADAASMTFRRQVYRDPLNIAFEICYVPGNPLWPQT
ncbi:MAG: hypothetical protein KDB00_05970 [Planctomycetales bacterium]|nr:hypothetical protein [Planctomycetales bacterium]